MCILEKREHGRIQRLPKFLEYSLLSQAGVKLRTSNFVRSFIGRSEQKPVKNFGKSSRGRTQGLSKFFRAPTYRAHRAVIFAVAQLLVLRHTYQRTSPISADQSQSVGSRQRLRSATRGDLVVSSSATHFGARAFAVAGQRHGTSCRRIYGH